MPVVFTTSGDMGEAFQRPIDLAGAHTGILRVEAEDAGMTRKISDCVSRKRKLMWMARFEAEVAKHNAPIISRSQNIATLTWPTRSVLYEMRLVC